LVSPFSGAESDMSRGFGQVQRAILTLIERDPGGAWSMNDLARRIYGCEPEKKHRVALLRALRNMPLPGTWELYFDEKKIGFLCDPCSDASMIARGKELSRRGRMGTNWRRWVIERAGLARRYRDAPQKERWKLERGIGEFEQLERRLMGAYERMKEANAKLEEAEAHYRAVSRSMSRGAAAKK
jgi:hypothetical protein